MQIKKMRRRRAMAICAIFAAGNSAALWGEWGASMNRKRMLLGLFCLACINVGGCASSLSPLRTSGQEVLKQKKTGQYISAGLSRARLTDERVKAAMAAVPRHKFVPGDVESVAYDDRALPIGFGQTISQPYVVALMTQEAKIKEGTKVLEIGTGSGYQAAVLSQLGARVYSVEIVPELAEAAKERLQEFGYQNVQIRIGDGWLGWEAQAPFDAILVTAASPGYPPALVRQLADGGRMVIPIEEEGSGESLMLVERKGGDFVTHDLGPVKFVPLTGEARQIDLEEPDKGK